MLGYHLVSIIFAVWATKMVVSEVETFDDIDPLLPANKPWYLTKLFISAKSIPNNTIWTKDNFYLQKTAVFMSLFTKMFIFRNW